MRWLLDIPIHRKLILITVLASGIALLLAGSIIVTYEILDYRDQKAQDITVQVKTLAASVTASLAFNDVKAAQEYLSALGANAEIVNAGLYTIDGTLFTSYTRNGGLQPPSTYVDQQGVYFEGNDLAIFWPVKEGNSKLGTVYLRANIEPLKIRLIRYGSIILLVMIGSLLITLPIATKMHSVIVSPIREIAEAARRIAAGELDVKLSTQARHDEIGFLEDKFQQMAESLQEKAAIATQISIGDLSARVTVQSNKDQLGNAFLTMTNNLREKADIATRIAAGDLTMQITPQFDKDVLGNAFVSMVTNLREITREINESVGVLTSSTSEILVGTTQMASGALETATSITETVVTVNEVKQTALLSSQKAKYVSDMATQTVQVSQTGKKSVEESIEGMQQTRGQMNLIGDSILLLSEQSQAIGEIIATVNDLAEQSNLLAVNASIEAARAGEHGKGFVVVAQEVRSLSERSRQATAQVRVILGDIQKATSSVVLAVEQGAKVVDAGAKQSEKAGETIQRLEDSISESARAATQIAVSAQQQLEGIEQLRLAMENINVSTTQNKESTKQAELVAHKLHGLGQKLKGLVERYKVA